MKLPVDLRALWARVLAWYNGYSERDRRWILGVLVLVGSSIVYVAVVEPILDYRKAAAEEIEAGHAKLEKSMRLVATKESLRAEREDLRKRLAQAKTRLLPGGTGTLGAAALQERANSLASEKGISVQSTQVMKEEVMEPFRKVAVRLTLSGELHPLAELVSGLEYGQQLAIPFIEVSRRGAVAGAKGPRTLSVTVEVNGFVQGGVPPKAEGPEGEVPAGEAPAGEGGPETAPGAGEGQAPGAATAIATDPEAVPATEPGAPAAGTPTPPEAPPPTPGDPAATGAPTSIVTPTIPPMTFPPMVIPTPSIPPTAPPPPIGPGAEPDEDEDHE